MILNLTQHLATAEQIQEEVINLPEKERKELGELLTFLTPPDIQDLDYRSIRIRNLALDYFNGIKVDPSGRKVMVGGAMYLMAPLVAELSHWGFKPLYSFSSRVSTEEVQPDGSVKKIMTFRHSGWVDPVGPTEPSEIISLLQKDDERIFGGLE